jgi:hypothetical protein
VETVKARIEAAFPDPDKPVDVIVIDPFRNIYQSGLSGGDLNEDLMAFFHRRLEPLLKAVNPKGGLIIAHHTNKITGKALQEDPMASVSGGGAILSYPSALSVLGRMTEAADAPLTFWSELRNGPSLGSRQILKTKGLWTEVSQRDMRLVRQQWGDQNDREQVRKRLKILDFIFQEASQGKVYTAASLAHTLSLKHKLGSEHTIRKHITTYEIKGFIRRFDNKAAVHYGLQRARNPIGYVCVEGMGRAETVDKKTGEILPAVAYLPTHYRHRSDTILPLSDEEVHRWVYDHTDDGEV